MEYKDISFRIAELEEQIADLPAGSISTKTVNGKEYYYHRWYVNGKRKEKYLKTEDVEAFRNKIELRKKLTEELKNQQKIYPQMVRETGSYEVRGFQTNVRIGASLRKFSDPVKQYKKRECYQQLSDFIYGDSMDKVFILYGLRRTGKTTLIRHIISEMNEADLLKTAFVQIVPKDTLAAVNHDLKYLEAQGYQYVFIDEVTLINDFIEGAALFSDVFAACGMKIVLSGTDSLGFLFSEDDALYDRCIMLHTTFIPYREFEAVLGVRGIDEYIRYGGTMSLGGVNYNETSTFSSKERADEYIDSAIARNIQHSLKCYQQGGHFRSLRELYEKKELTSAINRVVEDMNHRFTVEVLTKDFRSNDLAVSSRNIRNDRRQPTDILDQIDTESVTNNLRSMLEILNREEQTVTIEEAHQTEIKEYLSLLDMTSDIELVSLANKNRRELRTVIAQPGLRYAQVNALVESLLQDEVFNTVSLLEKNRIIERIRNEVKGRMMEDIVLLETQMAFPKKRIFKLQFAIGEFDMVVFDPATSSCEIFEVKHSAEQVAAQYKNLIDEKKCAETEFHYGTITAKYVIYRGESTEENGIYYVNVEEYLKNLV